MKTPSPAFTAFVLTAQRGQLRTNVLGVLLVYAAEEVQRGGSPPAWLRDVNAATESDLNRVSAWAAASGFLEAVDSHSVERATWN